MKSIKISILGLSLLTAVVGCKKEKLDITPTNAFTATATFKTVKDLDQGTLGIYSAWSGENTMIANAVLSDEVKLSTENRGQWQFEHKWQYASNTETFAYAAYYVMAQRANVVIAAAANVPVRNAAEQTQKDALVAEATALRAVAHFELLQRFGPAGYDPNAMGVSYVNFVTGSADRPARQKVSEVLAGIEADLGAAKANAGLPTSPQVLTGYGNIRLSKAFISGIQARVALYKRDWTNASTFATEAITNSGKTLATGSGFSGIWTDANDNEVMLRLRRVGTGVGTLWQDTNGDIFFDPSEKLKALYNRTTDIRFSSYFLVTPGGYLGDPDDTVLVKKFFSSSRGSYIVDVKLMRVAEMYLIRAEAKAELNDLPGASADINALRTARIAGYTPITYTDKNVAIADILNERFKELAFEGFRFFDLKRRGLAVNRLSSDVTSSSWQNLDAGNFKFALPIPQSTLFANPNQSQNPGY